MSAKQAPSAAKADVCNSEEEVKEGEYEQFLNKTLGDTTDTSNATTILVKATKEFAASPAAKALREESKKDNKSLTKEGLYKIVKEMIVAGEQLCEKLIVLSYYLFELYKRVVNYGAGFARVFSNYCKKAYDTYLGPIVKSFGGWANFMEKCWHTVTWGSFGAACGCLVGVAVVAVAGVITAPVTVPAAAAAAAASAASAAATVTIAGLTVTGAVMGVKYGSNSK